MTLASTPRPTALQAVTAADDCAARACPQGGRCVTIDATGKDLDKPACSAKTDDDQTQRRTRVRWPGRYHVATPRTGLAGKAQAG